MNKNIKISEKQIEQRLAAMVRQTGGLCWKFVSPGLTGVPDRICIKNGHVIFVEVKAPGQKPRPIQRLRHQQLANQNIPVHTIDHPNQVPEIINALQTPPLPNPSH